MASCTPSVSFSSPPWRLAAALAAALAVLVIWSVPAVAQSPRIQASPSDPSLAEGESVVVELRLAEPVISTTGPGVVTVDLSVDEGRLELSTPSVGWTAADWFEVRTVQISATDGAAVGSQPIVITGRATSDSEFYDQYSFVVEVTVVGGAPTTAPSSTTSTAVVSAPSDAATPGADASPGDAGRTADGAAADELAFTGASWELALLGVVLVVAGAAVLGQARRRQPVA